MRRLIAVMAVMALFGAACGDDDDDTTTTDTTAAAGEGGAEEVTIEVDGKADDFEMGTLAYFPDAVTVHPGTTVSFHSNDTGEPHTVTFGTVVDKGLEAGKSLPRSQGPPDPSKLTPEQKAALAEVEALDKALPTMLPEGPGDANQLSANPCFVAGDSPPGDTDKACPKMTEQPVFDGKHAVYSSGYLPGDETFEVELADDLAPGTYNFFCLLHRQGMTGTLTVVPEAEKAQTAEEVEQAGQKKLDELIAKLRPQAEELTDAPLEKASAGAPPPEGGGEGELPALLLAFGPKELAVPVGTAVTWSVFGPHTISFNVPEDAVGIMVKAPDGTFHANEKALAPAGGPGAPPPPDSEGPPDPKAKPVLVDGGRFDGEGFRSSGLILSFGPPGYQYKLTFTKTGTFEVRCQIHPDMKGTVKVA